MSVTNLLAGAAPVAAEAITLPKIDYAAILPMLIVIGGALLSILFEAIVPRAARYYTQLALSGAVLLAALVSLVMLAKDGKSVLTAGGAIAIDNVSLFLQGLIVVLGLVSMLLIAERALERGGPFVAQAAITAGSEADRRQSVREPGATEVYPLTLFALGGMMLFVATNDLLTMFVALEVLSLPLYLLCAMARRRRLISQEAALKYFLLGAFASAFFLFGLALVYGYAGSVSLSAIHAAYATGGQPAVLFFAGLALLAVGLLFKVAAVPFHVWTPDVYQGAPTPVTALMASCTKVAAFGALLRLLYVAFDGAQWDVQPIIGTIAVLTMIVGGVLAVTQTDIKRLLAYSSVANAGYLLVGALAFNKEGLAWSLFYLAAYGFTVIAAFAVVSLVRDAEGEATHLSRWAGLGRRSPLYAGVFTFLLLAFAGIPLTSGFTAKFGVFAAAIQGGQTWLVIAGVVSSMILAFPYLRVVVMMWLSEPGENSPTVSIPGALTSATLMIGVLATLVLGVFPTPVLDLAGKAAEFIR